MTIANRDGGSQAGRLHNGPHSVWTPNRAAQPTSSMTRWAADFPCPFHAVWIRRASHSKADKVCPTGITGARELGIPSAFMPAIKAFGMEGRTESGVKTWVKSRRSSAQASSSLGRPPTLLWGSRDGDPLRQMGEM
jgi:hypothetical protein